MLIGMHATLAGAGSGVRELSGEKSAHSNESTLLVHRLSCLVLVLIGIVIQLAVPAPNETRIREK